jgi:hypothetical protein
MGQVSYYHSNQLIALCQLLLSVTSYLSFCILKLNHQNSMKLIFFLLFFYDFLFLGVTILLHADHGTDGRNHSSRDTYPCYYNPHDSSYVTVRYQRSFLNALPFKPELTGYGNSTFRELLLKHSLIISMHGRTYRTKYIYSFCQKFLTGH